MSTASDRPISDMRVLVVDDRPDSANALADLLTLEFGCHTLVAYDGPQALHMAFAERLDVLILDIRMPGLSGIELARRIRASSTDAGAVVRPRLLAVTGQSDITTELAAIDGSFDGAFAKPVDHPRLFADLRRHWHGQPPRETDTRFELFDCFTRAVRDAMPAMAARHQTVSFDCEDQPIAVRGDEVALRSAMYRLLAGLADVLGAGFVVLDARALSDDAGRAVLTMSAAGTGELASPARIDEVVTRLALTSLPAESSAVRVARGLCPNCGGSVFFSSAPGEGALFRLTLTLTPVEVAEPVPHAAGARAWIVDDGDARAATLERRLQRFGWRVRRFSAFAEAVAAQADGSQPALVVLHESVGASAQAVAELADLLPPTASLVVLVAAGSRVLADSAHVSAAVRVEPLAPDDIGRLSRHALRADTGPASAWSTDIRPRSRVLVVDDNEVNRIVASGLVRALGYDVESASDGLDAIEHCKASPPDVVLMDVNMPVLGGIEATRRLRELQRIGRVAPFAIVAATANADDETARACLAAGMDGFLGKPLLLSLMHAELKRVTRHAG